MSKSSQDYVNLIVNMFKQEWVTFLLIYYTLFLIVERLLVKLFKTAANVRVILTSLLMSLILTLALSFIPEVVNLMIISFLTLATISYFLGNYNISKTLTNFLRKFDALPALILSILSIYAAFQLLTSPHLPFMVPNLAITMEPGSIVAWMLFATGFYGKVRLVARITKVYRIKSITLRLLLIVIYFAFLYFYVPSRFPKGISLMLTGGVIGYWYGFFKARIAPKSANT